MNWRPKENWRVPFVYEPAMDDVALYSHAEINSVYEAGADAMLSARDKNWIAWAQSTCPHNHLFNPETQEFDEDILKLECYQCWKERVESVKNAAS